MQGLFRQNPSLYKKEIFYLSQKVVVSLPRYLYLFGLG